MHHFYNIDKYANILKQKWSFVFQNKRLKNAKGETNCPSHIEITPCRVSVGSMAKLCCFLCSYDLDRPFSAIYIHPRLQVALCHNCKPSKDHLKSLPVDDSGCEDVCLVCYQGGTLLCCDTDSCPHTVCSSCCQQFAPSKKEDDKFYCFLCDPCPIIAHQQLLQNRTLEHRELHSSEDDELAAEVTLAKCTSGRNAGGQQDKEIKRLIVSHLF